MTIGIVDELYLNLVEIVQIISWWLLIKFNIRPEVWNIQLQLNILFMAYEQNPLNLTERKVA